MAKETKITSTKELRSFLVDQMHKVANGEAKVDEAKAIANLAQQVYNTLNIEIKMAQIKPKLLGNAVDPVSFE